MHILGFVAHSAEWSLIMKSAGDEWEELRLSTFCDASFGTRCFGRNVVSSRRMTKCKSARRSLLMLVRNSPTSEQAGQCVKVKTEFAHDGV